MAKIKKNKGYTDEEIYYINYACSVLFDKSIGEMMRIFITIGRVLFVNYQKYEEVQSYFAQQEAKAVERTASEKMPVSQIGFQVA